MPELPEVEYLVRQLREHLVGAQIAQVCVPWAGVVEHPTPDEFVREVQGQEIVSVDRRAKLILLRLSGNGIVVAHRRMTGNLELCDAGTPDRPHQRLAFTLADGRRLLYTDPRKFGRLGFYRAAELPARLANLGPEPLEPDFTAARLREIVRGSRRPIKAVLLDQEAIAGIGNIYADEALFNSRIHPLRPADLLAPREIARLREGIVTVLTTGIEHGGTTFGRHRDLFGDAGTNLDYILVYRRAGKPCMRCGTTIRRIVVAQRGTHYCPHCQPEPRYKSGDRHP
ncbi:MAG TPA: bifunctional DNA-formamidopyrimidine glycosylase/DNA-(apurinic or apyrimidinic site) lyase [Ktedonobacterales bacterium]|nr:bifunctional DNA-formamidopyrimidine glycosylase/DNA-(apurinic or apyrimidinic site) lyase [Ktedonobacterales bacterium]